MNITIDNCKYTPRWDTLQTLIREVTDDSKGVMIGINRKDGGCDYRGPGGYMVSFRQSDSSILSVNLEVA